MSGRRTITVRWRSLAALLPAVLLVGAGVALAQTGGVARPSDVSLPAVPSVPITQPPLTGAQNQPVVAGAGAPDQPAVAPGLVLPAGTTPGGSQPVVLDGPGIPAPALAAYRLAARLVGQADPACHIDWALVAAIGRVESDHGRYGGNVLDARGVAHPGIYGIRLDGSRGTAVIRDTDRGRLDHDTSYDRAVGPMQFIPGTWSVVGSDADGDGVKDPQNMSDAAAATAIYLCAGPGDLTRPGDLYSAIRRYNDSDSYVRTVIAIASAYRRGITTLPASALPAAHAAGGDGGTAGSGPVVEAAGASHRPVAAPTPAAPAATRPAGRTTSSTGSGSSGTTRSSPSSSAPTSPPVPGPVGSAVGSAAAPVVSTVVSLVTTVLKVPVVTTTTSCVVNPLGVQVCVPVPTTVTTTTTTTTPVTRTVTRSP